MVILSFFNLVWRMGEVPSSWRHAVVVPILKPDPLSYRPIALTSNMSKFMERLVKLFNINQSGFWKRRNTLDQLFRLSDDILKVWQKSIMC